MVKFISYDGTYPNLCSGTLIVEINGKEVNLGSCLSSGGCVWFDSDWGEHVGGGEWTIDTYDFPEEYLKYIDEITDVVNDNVDWGCCGGCV